jgi:hypothetical protein
MFVSQVTKDSSQNVLLSVILNMTGQTMVRVKTVHLGRSEIHSQATSLDTFMLVLYKLRDDESHDSNVRIFHPYTSNVPKKEDASVILRISRALKNPVVGKPYDFILSAVLEPDSWEEPLMRKGDSPEQAYVLAENTKVAVENNVEYIIWPWVLADWYDPRELKV